MKENNKFNTLFELYQQIFTQYEQIKDKPIEQALSEILEKNGYDPAKITETVDVISENIDQIQENYNSLKNAKQQGYSREKWLEQTLENCIEENKIQDKEELISGIKEGLKSSNTEYIKDIFEEKQNTISEDLKSNKFEDLNKKAIANNFVEELKNNTLFGAVVYDETGFKIDKEHKEIKTVKEFFEDKIDSKNEADIKKVVTTATTLAKEKDLIPFLKGKKIDEIAPIVDKGLFMAKIAYKASKGELKPIDVVEEVIDRQVSTVGTIVKQHTSKAFAKTGAAIGAKIGSIFGPKGTVIGAAVGVAAGYLAGTAVGQAVVNGVKKVVDVAKTVVKKAANVVAEGFKEACNWVKSWFK